MKLLKKPSAPAPKEKKIEMSGINNLVRASIKFNKRTVSMPIATWELIEVILKKLRIKLND